MRRPSFKPGGGRGLKAALTGGAAATLEEEEEEGGFNMKILQVPLRYTKQLSFVSIHVFQGSWQIQEGRVERQVEP